MEIDLDPLIRIKSQPCLLSDGRIVVIITVGNTAVVSPADPGKQSSLALADNHRVGLEYCQHLLR